MYSTESCEDWTTLVFEGSWPQGRHSGLPQVCKGGAEEAVSPVPLEWGTWGLWFWGGEHVPITTPKGWTDTWIFQGEIASRSLAAFATLTILGEAVSPVPLSTGTWGLMLWGGQHVPITSPRGWTDASTLTSMGNWLCLTKPWITPHGGMLSSQFFLEWVARSVPCGFVGGATIPWGARVLRIEKLQSWSWVPDQRVLRDYPLRPFSLRTEFWKP